MSIMFLFEVILPKL